jgi:hypothetical protein
MEPSSWVVTLAWLIASAICWGNGCTAGLPATEPKYALTGVEVDAAAYSPYDPDGPWYDMGSGWYDITPPSVRDFGYTVYKHDPSCESFLLFEGESYPIGRGFGGYGITSMALADLDKDGTQELYYTYSWGSGMHRAQVAYFNPVTRKERSFDFAHINGDMVLAADASGLTLYEADACAHKPGIDMDWVATGEAGTIRFEDGEIRLIPSQ